MFSFQNDQYHLANERELAEVLASFNSDYIFQVIDSYLLRRYEFAMTLKPNIVNAFKTDGIIGGLKRIGVVLMDTFLKPLQQIFEMISEFDPTGIADSALNKIKSLRENNNLVTLDEKQAKTRPMLAKIIEDQQK